MPPPLFIEDWLHIHYMAGGGSRTRKNLIPPRRSRRQQEEKRTMKTKRIMFKKAAKLIEKLEEVAIVEMYFWRKKPILMVYINEDDKIKCRQYMFNATRKEWQFSCYKC